MGRSSTFIASGKPFERSGDVVEYIGVTIDETERFRANAAMHEAQAELARVARLTTMGELAASIAHEIKQPLAAVVTYGNGALRWLAHAPPNLEETRDALKAIVAGGQSRRRGGRRAFEICSNITSRNTSRSTSMRRSERSSPDRERVAEPLGGG